MRQAQVPHVSDEILLACSAADARIVPPLFADGARGAALVVVTWKDQALVRQRQELVANGAKQPMRISSLKIGAPGAAHQQRIPGESELLISAHERQTAVGVAWGGADLERVGPEANEVAVHQGEVHISGVVLGREADRASNGPLHQPCAGDVVGVAVRVEGAEHRELELPDERGVTSVLLENAVDEHRLARARVPEKIGICAGGLIEELSKNHGAASTT